MNKQKTQTPKTADRYTRKKETAGNKSILFLLTLLAVSVFMLGEIVSIAAVYYGANADSLDTFQFGAFLFAFWMINPIPMILSVISLFRDKTHRKFYLAMVILLPIVWLTGVTVIAPYF